MSALYLLLPSEKAFYALFGCNFSAWHTNKDKDGCNEKHRGSFTSSKGTYSPGGKERCVCRENPKNWEGNFKWLKRGADIKVIELFDVLK